MHLQLYRLYTKRSNPDLVGLCHRIDSTVIADKYQTTMRERKTERERERGRERGRERERKREREEFVKKGAAKNE